MMESPLLTVCVCTRNRPRYLADCLAGLRFQSVPPGTFETIVVDSASDPEAAREICDLAAALPNTRLIRLEKPGISLARNAGAASASTEWIAYIDDDAIPAANWVTAVLEAVAPSGAPSRPPAMIGGRILPLWEAPLPRWWPRRLRGVLSIIEHERPGEYRSEQLPDGLEPYAANLVVHVPALLAARGFRERVGRLGDRLLSDEEVELAWRLQDAGHSVRYDPRLVVRHRIQAARLNPAWLLRRLFWQGASTVMTRRLLGQHGSVWRALPRRAAVAALFGPATLLPGRSHLLIGARWRAAYSAGFVCAALLRGPAARA